MHAGGVLIAPGRLTDFCPLYAAEGAVNVISQFDKDDVEAIGLVKFDFLGLTTLTILDWAERYVRRMGDSGLLRSKRSRSDDASAYKLLSAGNTTAVFQLESRGMRDLHQARAARPLRGHHRAGRALPPGPDGPDSGVHRAQARQARRVPRPAPGADPRADLRHHGLPGAGDADRAGDRRLHARRRRPAAPRDGQEEARGDGAAARHLRRRRGEERPVAGARRRSSST